MTDIVMISVRKDYLDGLLRENDEMKKDIEKKDSCMAPLAVRLSKLERVAEAAEVLSDHPSFCIGTRSCEAMPQGVMPRMKDLREALQALRGSTK